jgi:hypothetical protein
VPLAGPVRTVKITGPCGGCLTSPDWRSVSWPAACPVMTVLAAQVACPVPGCAAWRPRRQRRKVRRGCAAQRADANVISMTSGHRRLGAQAGQGRLIRPAWLTGRARGRRAGPGSGAAGLRGSARADARTARPAPCTGPGGAGQYGTTRSRWTSNVPGAAGRRRPEGRGCTRDRPGSRPSRTARPARSTGAPTSSTGRGAGIPDYGSSGTRTAPPRPHLRDCLARSRKSPPCGH